MHFTYVVLTGASVVGIHDSTTSTLSPATGTTMPDRKDASVVWIHSKQLMRGLSLYTMSHKIRSQLIFVCNFVKNQRILMQFSLLELTMNDTCDSMNFTHIT